MPMTLLLFGPARLLADGRDRPWPPDRRFQLLTHLACRADWVSRDHLQYLFWPDHAPKAARGNLRQLLSRVRALGMPGLEVERERLRWLVNTDVAAFLQKIQERRWEEAIARYGGPFLAGQEADGTGEFAAWVQRERDRLRGASRTALLRRAEELREASWHLEAADLLAAGTAAGG